MDKEIIKKILEAGVQAPSGSNSQPWKFRIRENEIDILAFPEKDHPVLNFRNRGTWIAHGALIENILITAPAFGYRANITMVPYNLHSRVVATILFDKIQDGKDTLYDAIFSRTTNRKPYKDESLTSEQKKSLLDSVRGIQDIETIFIEDKGKMKILGEAVAASEIVMFENQLLHKLMFEEIVWTREEEKKHGGGLYVKTMEVRAPQELAMRVFRLWSIAKIFNKLGLARTIAGGNSKIYASSAIMGIIAVPDRDEFFFNAGRVIERLWLNATELGLSFHLITGVMFLWMRIVAGEAREFSEEHIAVVKDAYQKIISLGGIKDDKVATMVFRVGTGGEPSARSLKEPPQIII